MEEVLSRLLVPDNEVIKKATEDLRTAFKQPGVIPELCRILSSSQSPQVRQYAAVLLRKKFSKSKSWKKFSAEDKAHLKSGCLASLQSEQEKIVIAALTQLIATIAKHELPASWPELMQFLQAKVSSGNGAERILGMSTISVLAEVAGEQLTTFLKDFLAQFRKTLEDSEAEVCYFTVVTLTHFVRRTGSDEANQFQQLIPTILQKIQMLVKWDQEKATIAIDVFDELIESEVGMVIPHIKPILELCIALANEKDLDDSLRIKAITFLGRLTRLKKKTIVKNKLYIPMINVIFSVMCSQDVEDDDEDLEEDDDSPALAASQSLDILALHLPPEKYISALLTQVTPALESNNPIHVRAAYQAIAVSAEGCQEHIRSKYLSHFLEVMGRGIRHQHHLVRNAALYMLGQFSEFIQPEISDYAGEILPVLYEYLDAAFASFQPGVKESSSVSRIFYALDTFCENLEEKLVPHLDSLIKRALASTNENFSIRVRELGISLIGSAANAVNSDIVPYFEEVIKPLHKYLTMEHNDETQVLLTQSMSTLSILARCVGKEQFKAEFAEQCIKIGMELVQKNNDPDVRKCAYSLFGAVASIVKEDMSLVMETCVGLMLKTIQSTEGISLELNGHNDSNLPLEQLDEDEDEISLEDSSTEQAVEDLEDVKAISVENAYVGEKECAIRALKDLSVECGVAFHPYINQCMEEILTMMDYPDDDVKSAAVEAAAFFLIAYFKSGPGNGMEAFNSGLSQVLPKLLELVVTEPEHNVVVASLDAITELLKQCKGGVTEVDGNPNKIAACIQKIMKGECACQDQDDDDSAGLETEEDEEAEQDEMLFEYAGEVLPNLGRAMNPATFSPFFTGLFPLLLKKAGKKQSSTAERSFAVGALADCMEPLQGKIDPYMKHLLPVFLESFNDSENDVRNNGVYGVGEMVLWGGEAVAPHYPQILAALANLLNQETAPRVIDQIVGAVSRFIVANMSGVPMDKLLPVLMGQLPLKEDHDEYEIVFKAFGTMYRSGGAAAIQPCVPKILECVTAFYTAKDTDKEKVGPLAVELVKIVSKDFPADFQSILANIPQEVAASLANIANN